ncbi:ubiquinone biosynthesis protein UbiJ [Idiomarina fontislapidosi]|uniref:Ubiquinone biosynthesis accessory factor UbiJ n=1 Tax=Idiomarina fontislapidosi TaxID=263723 RepID=A0A432Y7S9_9GAMM|nr:SCP2 sterol-binding domain-containing protein [Idiomarina fontislapidosi]PYE32326.1 ubiquinone biosynthesis protein UbiJ [Idiomarina fontislapidosi]RUO57030.1 hypothetical protein CWE25_04975 [Idiomarina fontislapidosi]|tara:strand:- start:1276 stop:1869 length:594 start_codon:yes stop_codon:yes gene_type:complete
MIWHLIPWMVLERTVNALLQHDPNSSERLQQLAGKHFRFSFKELPFDINIAVHTDGIALSSVDDGGPLDCHVRTELGVLPELSDTANLTRLIKADQLDIDGDPMLAQQLVNLFKALDIDWEAKLAEKLGDGMAHRVSTLFKQSRERFKQHSEVRQRWLKGVLTEEKQVLPNRLEFELFKDDVQALRAQIERLQRKLK